MATTGHIISEWRAANGWQAPRTSTSSFLKPTSSYNYQVTDTESVCGDCLPFESLARSTFFFNMASISWVADSPLWRMFSRFVFALVGPESSSSNTVASTADHSPWLMGSTLHGNKFRQGIFWYGPLASPWLQIASMGLDHHGKTNGGPNQWIRVRNHSTVVNDSSLPSR